MIAKYRGWTIDTKQEVKGCYFRHGGQTFIIPITDEWHTPASKACSFVEVSPESVGQFTGKRDSKRTKEYPEGQEIYGGFDNKGGDVCIINKNAKVLVDWNNNEGGFVWMIIGKNSFWSWHWATVRLVEVIGNATEHPDLLKGEQE